jgi:hypothetical protein
MGGSVAKLYKEMLNASRAPRFSAWGERALKGATLW